MFPRVFPGGTLTGEALYVEMMTYHHPPFGRDLPFLTWNRNWFIGRQRWLGVLGHAS